MLECISKRVFVSVVVNQSVTGHNCIGIRVAGGEAKEEEKEEEEEEEANNVNPSKHLTYFSRLLDQIEARWITRSC